MEACGQIKLSTSRVHSRASFRERQFLSSDSVMHMLMIGTTGTNISGTLWGLIAAGATAVIAIVTLVLRERQTKRENLDQKVANAVNAGIGRTLLDYREFEADVRTSLDAAAKSAAGIEHQLRERLEGSEEHSKRLAELLERAADVVPRLETSRHAIPAMLLAEAARAESPDDALGLLSALLDAKDATADDLEAAADLARERFGADALALALYKRATATNPALVTAQASLLLLQTHAGLIPLAEGKIGLSTLAKDNSTNRNAVSEAFNVFTTYGDYAGLLILVDELLALNSELALLWRNRAVALVHLGRTSEGEEAYRRAYEISDAKGDDHERSNTARPYAVFLMEERQFDRAAAVLEGALGGDPDSSGLLRLLGDLSGKMADDQRAALYYKEALASRPNPNEARMIQMRLDKLAARSRLKGRGLLAQDEGHAKPNVDGAEPAPLVDS